MVSPDFNYGDLQIIGKSEVRILIVRRLQYNEKIEFY
jgi:hypothetical protein